MLRNDNPDIPAGFGARLLAIIVDQARKLGNFKSIALYVAGGRLKEENSPNGDRWGGYFVWPDYGFDAELEPESLDIFSYDVFPYYPTGIPNCNTISDVLSVDEGRNHWRVLGVGGSMEFDLSPNSWSIDRLNMMLYGRGV